MFFCLTTMSILDINECLEQPDLCDHGQCVNKLGTFVCDCEIGYVPHEDRKSCTGKKHVTPPRINLKTIYVRLYIQSQSHFHFQSGEIRWKRRTENLVRITAQSESGNRASTMWWESCSANQQSKSPIKKKSPQTFAHIVNFSKNASFMFIQSCYCDYRINKTLECSRSVICVSRSVHVISTYYARKGSWDVLSLLPTNQRVRKIRSHSNLVPRAPRVT